MVHEKGSTAIQHMCGQFVQCLVARSSNNQDLCVCLQCPLPAFVLRSQVVNPISVWVLTVKCEYRYHCTDPKKDCHHQQDDHECVLLLLRVIVAITFLQLLTVCNIIAIPEIKTFIEGRVIYSM